MDNFNIAFFFAIGIAVSGANIYGDFKIIRFYRTAIKSGEHKNLLSRKWLEAEHFLLGHVSLNEEVLIIGHSFVYLWFGFALLWLIRYLYDLFGVGIFILDAGVLTDMLGSTLLTKF